LPLVFDAPVPFLFDPGVASMQLWVDSVAYDRQPN
jgi:hypothetical protein